MRKEDEELESKLNHYDVDVIVNGAQDVTQGNDEHYRAVDLVDDGHPRVEVVQQCGITGAVPFHLDEVDRVAQEVDHQQDDGKDDDVDVEKPAPIGHSIQVSKDGQDSQGSPRQLDEEEINSILVFSYPFQHFARLLSA